MPGLFSCSLGRTKPLGVDWQKRILREINYSRPIHFEIIDQLEGEFYRKSSY
jgi:hypothetical protein